MNFIDYYKILEIDKNSTANDIKKAYRKLARKYHPDLNPNDVDAKKNFQQINEANEVLSDPEKRKKYDKYGKDWQHAEQFEKAKQNQEQSSDYGGQKYSREQTGGDFSDFFESMFGGSANAGKSRQVKFRGEDYNAQLHLDLTDAFKTHKQTLTVNGRSIRITIPAGIENGQTIKIAGHGGTGINGGPNGDLYITFSIANHPGIKRLGNDLIAINEFCVHHNIGIAFITLLQQNGLIEISTIESQFFVQKEQLPQLEKFVHFYYDLDINLEGIETINYLLKRIENQQNEIVELKNRLRFYEG
jgi:curved DNA-binding protein